ncbi:MAG: translation initiation factor eIF-1A [Nitrososphaeria archaeon]
MGKRKVLSEANLKNMMKPSEGELLGRVKRLSGGDLVIVDCIDGKARLCRIRGKMKRRMWVREDDIVLIAPWDFDDNRADVLWRYRGADAEWLALNGYLPSEL